MRAALRPYVTAGIALTGATVIAAGSVAPPAQAAAANTTRTSSAAVQLLANVDVSGATVLTLSPSDSVTMADTLQGSICAQAASCKEVDYLPWWGIPGQFPYGVEALQKAIEETPGKKVIYTHSSGALVVAQWYEKYGKDYDQVADGELQIITLGNPSRKYGGSNNVWGETFPQDMPFHVTDITRQYDSAADWPSNPFNLIAQANSLSAFFLTHLKYNDVDLNDPDNIKWTDPNTGIDYVFSPTDTMPLLDGLRWTGAGSVADALEDAVREAVEKGYNRNIPGVDNSSFLPTSGKSFDNVLPNLFNAILNIPMTEIQAMQRFTAAMEESESWWVYSPVNVLGWDPPNLEMTRATVDMLLPFKPLSTPAGDATLWYLAANLPMYAGCSGFPPCDDPWGMLDHMFKVPAWDFYLGDGYTFPTIFNPISDQEWAAGEELGQTGEEVSWSGQTVKLDAYAGLASMIDYLVSPPTGVQFPTLNEVVTTFANLGKAMWASFNPFVPQSTIWNPKMSLAAYLVRPFAKILCPSCNQYDPFMNVDWKPGDPLPGNYVPPKYKDMYENGGGTSTIAPPSTAGDGAAEDKTTDSTALATLASKVDGDVLSNTAKAKQADAVAASLLPAVEKSTPAEETPAATDTPAAASSTDAEGTQESATKDEGTKDTSSKDDATKGEPAKDDSTKGKDDSTKGNDTDGAKGSGNDAGASGSSKKTGPRHQLNGSSNNTVQSIKDKIAQKTGASKAKKAPAGASAGAGGGSDSGE